jgi:ribosomal protein S18 acetylase RimI-like enzyme
MDAFETRSATPADADAVADYHHRCFATTYASQLLAGEFEAPDEAGTRQELHDRFLPESDCDTHVVVVDDVPIAHVTVSGQRLVHLFVAPERQSMGLGRYLLELGEAMIVAGGHEDFELHARVENLDAIAFYEKAGWTVTDRIIHTVEHGISYDERVLVKHLGEQFDIARPLDEEPCAAGLVPCSVETWKRSRPPRRIR